MAQNAKKVDWEVFIRLAIVVLTALLEVVGGNSEEKNEVETKSIDSKK